MTKWGGKRDGAGSGGKRDGAGRPRKQWDSGGKGSAWVVERARAGGFPGKPELWTVLSVSDGEIEFQCGDDIITFVRPDDV